MASFFKLSLRAVAQVAACWAWGTVLAAGVAGGIAQGAKFPAAAWPTALPREVGMNAARLHAARDYALSGEGSGIVIRKGKAVLTWGDQAALYDLKSTAKSIGATLLGLALLDGKVQLDDPAREHHPSFGTPPATNAEKGWLEKITLRHLATHTAGFDKVGGYTELLFAPGTEWHYSDGAPNWLAECLTHIYGRDLNEVMFERVFTPIGITPRDLRWRANSYRPHTMDGVARREFGSGFHANVSAMARLGYLYLHEGKWGERQIISPAFVREAGRSAPQLKGLPERGTSHGNASEHYGLLWWNNGDATIPGLPRDAFWSWGLFDSTILVIPSLDLVAAHASKSWKRTSDERYDVLKPFFVALAASVQDPAFALRTTLLDSHAENALELHRRYTDRNSR